MKQIPNAMFRSLRRGAALVAVAGVAGALPAAAGSSDWKPVVAEVSARGLAAPEADALADLFRECERDGLPVGFLTARLREGLAKDVQPELIARAARARADALRGARDLLAGAGFGPDCGAAHPDLLASMARALESGVAADALREAARRSGGTNTHRLQAVVESGELLHLAGLDAGAVRVFMEDCQTRALGRMEVLRAVQFTIQRHRGGMSPAEIRDALWGSGAGRRGGGGGQGHGGGGHAEPRRRGGRGGAGDADSR